LRTRLGLIALGIAVLWAALAVAPAFAQEADDSYEDLLGGFGDDDAADDDGLGGFGDDEADDDGLGGFDDAADSADAAGESARKHSWADDYIDLTGSVSLGASYNLRPHCASAGPPRAPIESCGEPPKPTSGTFYGNLQRLRLRGDLQADFALPFDWKARIQGFAWYDFAYQIHGREKYTPFVIEDYELRAEVLDFYVEGSVTSWLDLKLGRQVVNWGRSDTLRVNDILNALNNLEPGLTDIEDLRLPSTMAKVDAYWWKLSFTAIVIPEIRFDWDPPPGNDFYPRPNFLDLPPVPPGAAFSNEFIAAQLAMGLGSGFLVPPLATEVDQWGGDPEYAGAITGIFSGWDFSLYVARVYQNRTTPVINLPTFNTTPVLTRDDRVTMVGVGGNYTVGSWLFKAEAAWFDELDYVFLLPNPNLANPLDFMNYWLPREAQLSRLDYMLGIEYYGWADTNIALEAAHRHFFNYNPLLAYLPNYVHKDNIEIALRMSRDLMNARLTLGGVALVLLNSDGFFGSTIRLDASYELMDGLDLTGGLLYFIGGEQIPFDTWADNDRLFAKIKYSF
jgi:hypothetical protein